MEQRDVLAPRIFFDGEVALEREGETLETGRAYNVSLRGIFVRMAELLPLDTVVRARFALPDGHQVAADATVVRVCDEASLEPTGIALRFDRLLGDARGELQTFVEASLRPARGETLHLGFEDVSTPVVVHAQGDWEDVIAVDAELPFLRLGAHVQLTGDVSTPPRSGAIRWVSIHVCPETGVPRLNVGIELDDEGEPAVVDEEHDPILSDRYARHAEAKDREMRAAKRDDEGS